MNFRMPFVSVVLTDGLGNRFFQIAAMLGYAEKYGHTPVFLKEHVQPNPHEGIDVIPMFPEIPTIGLSDVGVWEEFCENNAEVFHYMNYPGVAGNVLLRGCFQNCQYFPQNVLKPRIPVERELQKNTAFLHIRRGDYLHELCKHHNVDLGNYYENCLVLFRGARILVCSNDLAWCREELPKRYRHVAAENWLWCEGGTLETLAEMATCERGGICANIS